MASTVQREGEVIKGVFDFKSGMQYLRLIREEYSAQAFDHFGFSPEMSGFYRVAVDKDWFDKKKGDNYGLIEPGDDGELGGGLALIETRVLERAGIQGFPAGDVESLMKIGGMSLGPCNLRKTSLPVASVASGELAELDGKQVSKDSGSTVSDSSYGKHSAGKFISAVDESDEVEPGSESEYLQLFAPSERSRLYDVLGSDPGLLELLNAYTVAAAQGEAEKGFSVNRQQSRWVLKQEAEYGYAETLGSMVANLPFGGVVSGGHHSARGKTVDEQQLGHGPDNFKNPLSEIMDPHGRVQTLGSKIENLQLSRDTDVGLAVDRELMADFRRDLRVLVEDGFVKEERPGFRSDSVRGLEGSLREANPFGKVHFCEPKMCPAGSIECYGICVVYEGDHGEIVLCSDVEQLIHKNGDDFGPRYLDKLFKI